jgi:hypothetical protein
MTPQLFATYSCVVGCNAPSPYFCIRLSVRFAAALLYVRANVMRIQPDIISNKALKKNNAKKIQKAA